MIKIIMLSMLLSLNVFAFEGSTTDIGAAESLTTNAANPKCFSWSEVTSFCSKSNQGYFTVYGLVRKGDDGLWRVEKIMRVDHQDPEQ